MAAPKKALAGILNAMGGISGLPAPTGILDFTVSLPGSVTFTRASTATYITNGVLSALATGTPAFESWGGKLKGMRLSGAAQNLVTYSNDFTNAAWNVSGATKGTGALGVDGTTTMGLMTEDTSTAYHGPYRNLASVTSGTTHTFSIVLRRPAGTTRSCVVLRMGNQFDTVGSRLLIRWDGVFGYTLFPDPTNQTNVSAKVVDLGNGLILASITGTWSNAGTKSFYTFTSGGSYGAFVGSVSQALEIGQGQITTTNGMAPYIDNPAGTLNSMAAESAILTTPAWLNTTAGTFVIEHDMQAGTLLGSGANAIMTATLPGKTALAYDATGSSMVNNGLAATAGGVLTFSGADLRLLGTSVAQSFGHIKSLVYYPGRLTVTQLQKLTSPVSTSSPGAWRIATNRARLPTSLEALTGTKLAVVSRCATPVVGSYSKLKVDFANWNFPGNPNGNAFYIDSLYLERVTGVAESIRIMFGGSGSVTLAPGATNILSDEILPTQFTGITAFTSGDYRLRLKGHVTTANQTVPMSRWPLDPSGVQVFSFDPAVCVEGTDYSALSGTGGISFTGPHAAPVRAPSPILVGIPSSGDPKSFFVVGDSIIEGTNLIAGYTWIEKACVANGDPCLVFCQGGSSQVTITATPTITGYWFPYLAYARVLIDEMGTNLPSNTVNFFDYWNAAKKIYNYDKICHVGLIPNATNGVFTGTSATNVGTTATITVGTGTPPPVGATLTISSTSVMSPPVAMVPAAYGGTFTVTASDATTFSYTMASNPGGPATSAIRWQDNFATEANQIVTRAFPSDQDTTWAYYTAAGQMDLNHNITSIRGTNQSKWLSNGISNYYTVEGVHPTGPADDMMAAEIAPYLAALPVTS